MQQMRSEVGVPGVQTEVREEVLREGVGMNTDLVREAARKDKLLKKLNVRQGAVVWIEDEAYQVGGIYFRDRDGSISERVQLLLKGVETGDQLSMWI